MCLLLFLHLLRGRVKIQGLSTCGHPLVLSQASAAKDSSQVDSVGQNQESHGPSEYMGPTKTDHCLIQHKKTCGLFSYDMFSLGIEHIFGRQKGSGSIQVLQLKVLTGRCCERP